MSILLLEAIGTGPGCNFSRGSSASGVGATDRSRNNSTNRFTDRATDRSKNSARRATDKSIKSSRESSRNAAMMASGHISRSSRSSRVTNDVSDGVEHVG